MNKINLPAAMKPLLRLAFFSVLFCLGAGCDLTKPSPLPEPSSPTESHAPHASPGTVSNTRETSDGWRAYNIIIDAPESQLVIEGPNQYRQTIANAEPIGFSPDRSYLAFIAPALSGRMSVYAMRLLPPSPPFQLTNTDSSIRSTSDPRYVPIPDSPDDVTWGRNSLRYTAHPPGAVHTVSVDVESGQVQHEAH